MSRCTTGGDGPSSRQKIEDDQHTGTECIAALKTSRGFPSTPSRQTARVISKALSSVPNTAARNFPEGYTRNRRRRRRPVDCVFLRVCFTLNFPQQGAMHDRSTRRTSPYKAGTPRTAANISVSDIKPETKLSFMPRLDAIYTPRSHPMYATPPARFKSKGKVFR